MKKEALIKHSAAIAIENSINLIQRQTWNVLLANAYYDLPSSDRFYIGLSKLRQDLGFTSHNNAHLKTSLKALVQCMVEWNLLGKDGKDIWGAATLLASAEIQDNIVSYSYSSHLRERLHNPNMYARIQLSIQKQFDSKHTLALYELCVDYYIAKRGEGVTPWILLDDFKKLMGVQNEYPKFRDFNKWVLKTAMGELNEKSDLRVEVEFKRERRRISALRLQVRRNPNRGNLLRALEIKTQEPQQLALPTTPEGVLVMKLHSYGIQEEKTLELVQHHGIEEVERQLGHLEHANANGKIENPGAWFIKALEESWQPPSTCKTTADREAEAQQKELYATAKKMIEEGDLDGARTGVEACLALGEYTGAKGLLGDIDFEKARLEKEKTEQLALERFRSSLTPNQLAGFEDLAWREIASLSSITVDEAKNSGGKLTQMKFQGMFQKVLRDAIKESRFQE